jgi:hypothetical protein
MINGETILELVELYENYYNNFDDITGYYLSKKYERLGQKEYPDISNKIFNKFFMSPNEMDISIEIIDGKTFNDYTTQIATFPIESQIGRRITIGVKENNTDTYLGFIRLASPVSSIKPRNDFFNTNLRLDTINKYFYNGQTIVPVQPFGFNYLGGKLLALICVSNEVKDIFNKKYDTDISVFETTSLYGSSKSSSMYDGLEPYIKFKGLTISQNILTPTDNIYFTIRDKIREYYGNPDWNNSLVNPKGSSPKTRELNKMIQILKNHLKQIDMDRYKEFDTLVKTKSTTYQQKRYYLSTGGIQNIQDVILNRDTPEYLNKEKYDLNNIISYWKNKSQKRWENVIVEDKIKWESEIYTKEIIEEGLKFNIIR